MNPVVSVADLFCGAGGTSTGLVDAAREMDAELDLLAVNHWQVAVSTHERNHPDARHLCADLSTIDPNKAVPSGRLDILIASPECTHHSVARGGKPCSDQSRASAWHVVHWAERLSPSDILVENVREFESWGPLLATGRPDPKKKGESFRAWVMALESFGYRVDWRVLNAADFGDATCRYRLFVRATKNGDFRWPDPSHTKDPGLLGGKRWRPARDVIDWSVKGTSIFRRKRPLKPKTIKRIEAGLRKFGGEAFIAVLRGTDEAHLTGSSSRSVDDPLPTVCASGNHVGLCEPFIAVMRGTKPSQSNTWAVSVDDPLPPISCGIHHALCQPFVIGQQSCAAPRSVDDPLPTISTAGAISMVQPFIIPMEHSGRQPVRSVDDPLPTITTAKGGAFGVCEPFVTKYYGSGEGAKPVSDPLDTITAKDRFALVEPTRMDILFRMLQPHELAAAMGFEDYVFEGSKTDQVRQIGNAVARRTARALCRGMLVNVIGRYGKDGQGQ